MLKQNCRVLLLDDNLFTSARVASALKSRGCEVVVATSGAHLGTSTCSGEFAIVLLNLGSRSLAGIAQVSTVRERFDKARIVGFCGHLEIEIRREAKNAGIDRLLTNEQVFSTTDWLD